MDGFWNKNQVLARKPFDFHLVSVRLLCNSISKASFADEELICKRAIPNAKRDFVQFCNIFFSSNIRIIAGGKKNTKLRAITQRSPSHANQQRRLALKHSHDSGKKKKKGKRMLTLAAKCCRGMQTLFLFLVCMCVRVCEAVAWGC